MGDEGSGMSNELAQRDKPDLVQLGTLFANSGFFQDSRDAAQAIVKILAGRELGFSEVASMTNVYIVKGKVSMSAVMMASLIKRSGKYNYRILEHTDSVCEIEFTEGKDIVGRARFSIDDAKQAGILSDNYRKFPRDMLFARAMSRGAKWFCADVFGGGVYVPEELDAEIVETKVDEKAVSHVTVRHASPLQAQLNQAKPAQLPAPTPQPEPEHTDDKPGELVADPLDDNAAFMSAIDDALVARGFPADPDVLDAALKDIKTIGKISDLKKLRSDRRHRLITAINDGKFDNLKTDALEKVVA